MIFGVTSKSIGKVFAKFCKGPLATQEPKSANFVIAGNLLADIQGA